MSDHLAKYMTDAGFDFPRLLNDDFIAPIRLLHNNRYYVAATKLLMSYIDTLGFLEYGDSVRNPFTEWLNNYADLTDLGVAADELWEHRNSLLHMSNLDSRKVVGGKIKRIVAYVGELPDGFVSDAESDKYFSLIKLLEVIANACGQWLSSLNENREKFKPVISRYDQIVTDNRLQIFRYEGGS